MAWKVTKDSVSGVVEFELLNDKGKCDCSFEVVPDVKLYDSINSVISALQKAAETAPEIGDVEAAAKFDTEIAKAVTAVATRRSAGGMFEILAPTHIMTSGKMLASEIVDALVEHLKPIFEEMARKRNDAVAKHTAKYAPQIPTEVIDRAVAAAGCTLPGTTDIGMTLGTGLKEKC